MQSVSRTLAHYMKLIGVGAFSKSLYLTANSLDRFCRMVMHNSLHAILARTEISAPSKFDGWSLPDALWLADCKRLPELSHYPLGEIAERAYKRTVLWLAFFSGQNTPYHLDSDIKTTQRNIRSVIRSRGIESVMSFFMSEFLYEVCRDWRRRSRTEEKDDACYQYHYTENGDIKSIAQERQEQTHLLKRCRRLADIFNKALMESVIGNVSKPLTDRLIKLYLDTFGTLPRGSKTSTSRKKPLNVVAGNKPVSELKKKFNLHSEFVRLSLHEKRSNISLDHSSIERKLADLLDDKSFKLHSLSRDLLDIGAVVYFADQMVNRDKSLKRRLDILMPVMHYSLWNEVKGSLSETVSFLGRDEVNFHFIKRKGKMQPLNFHTKQSQRCVSLFSGGLDSAAGALWILNEKLDPLLVSHHSNSHTSGLQNHLLDELKHLSGQDPSWLSIFVGKSHKKRKSHPLGRASPSPMTQFLRSFLFLCMASVVAIELHMDTLCIFENGPVALNPMFSEGRINTRTAHPRFLASFQTLVEMLFKTGLEIENPFLYQTKGDVASFLAKPGFDKLVNKTNSCWNWIRVPMWAQKLKIREYNDYHHDGSCLPCVIRRASLLHAGLEKSDGNYLRDVFTDFTRFDIPDQVLIADYLRFCRNIETMDDAELLMEHPDFSVYAADVDVKQLIAMYRRHAREMVDAFCRQGSDATLHRLIPS